MPIYEYQCESCEYLFEVQQKFSDPPIEACGQCGKNVRKLISAPGIMFKGTGWYVTDYSNKLKDPNLSKPSASDGGKQDSGASGASGGDSGTSGVSGGDSGGDSNSSGAKSDSTSTSSSSSSSPSSSTASPSTSSPSPKSSS